MAEVETSQDVGFAPLVDGGHLSYAISGRSINSQAPLLLIRPLGGSMALWSAGGFLAQLAAERRVICFDARGTGRSSPAPLRTTTRRLAGDAISLLDHLHVAQADVFGLSLGGMVATWLAIDAPARVRRLILGSTVRRGIDVSRHGFLRALSLGRCLLRPTMAQVEVCMLRRILSSRFRHEHPDEMRPLEDLIRAEPASRAGLLRLLAAAALHDPGDELHSIRAPTLVLWGALDPLLRRDTELALKRSIRDARLEVIANSGHDLTLEQPLATAARLDTFLSDGD